MALFVCQESRAIALQRYELVFVGENKVVTRKDEVEETAMTAAQQGLRKGLRGKRTRASLEFDEVIMDELPKPPSK